MVEASNGASLLNCAAWIAVRFDSATGPHDLKGAISAADWISENSELELYV